ncbi:MAG: hypothetical protein Q4B10_03320 [Actinomycetaceae bacterium]|nr:hypothetical protein [Actinomycetaceae bacterium]
MNANTMTAQMETAADTLTQMSDLMDELQRRLAIHTQDDRDARMVAASAGECKRALATAAALLAGMQTTIEDERGAAVIAKHAA